MRTLERDSKLPSAEQKKSSGALEDMLCFVCNGKNSDRK
jgi:hypothetical protein